MSTELDATMYYEHATDWVFLRFDEEPPYGVLDAAENELHGRDDLDDLIDAAEGQDDGTSRLELGTVTYSDDGGFEELTVTRDE